MPLRYFCLLCFALAHRVEYFSVASTAGWQSLTLVFQPHERQGLVELSGEGRAVLSATSGTDPTMEMNLQTGLWEGDVAWDVEGWALAKTTHYLQLSQSR